MASVFTRVLAGELPGRIVHEDELCAALLTVAPIRPGHTLVVPRAETDSWLDLPPELAAHLFTVARRVGDAIREALGPSRVGLVVAGLEVPHCHLHVLPMDSMADLDFANADPHPDPAVQDDVADRLRAALTG